MAEKALADSSKVPLAIPDATARDHTNSNGPTTLPISDP
jgi:hypothetical protein